MTYVAEPDREWTLEELAEMVSAKRTPLRCRIVPGRDAALSQEDALGTARTSSATRRQVANRRLGV